MKASKSLEQYRIRKLNKAEKKKALSLIYEVLVSDKKKVGAKKTLPPKIITKQRKTVLDRVIERINNSYK